MPSFGLWEWIVVLIILLAAYSLMRHLFGRQQRAYDEGKSRLLDKEGERVLREGVRMTKLNETTTEAAWLEIEEQLDRIAALIAGRCYSEHRAANVRRIVLLIRHDLATLDQLLLEIEHREE